MKQNIQKITLIICATLALYSCTLTETKEKLLTVTGGAVGYFVGDELCGGKRFQRGCQLAGTALGAYIGNKIGKKLDEQDRVRMAANTQQAFITGEDSSWKNDKNNTGGQAKIVETKSEPKPIKVKVLKAKVEKVPPLDIIGATYTANQVSNVRGGPSTDFVIVGQLSKDEATKVIGKVKERNWLLISQNGIGSGFVSGTLLAPAPAAPIKETSEEISSADVEEQQIASNRLCRTIENSVTLADGTVEKETLNACQGPNGWEIQPAIS